jgi:hypothetical protein
MRSVLSNLLHACTAREHAYLAAADAVRSSPAQNVFLAYARQRAMFARELALAITRMGGGPPNRIEPAASSGVIVTDLDAIVDALGRGDAELASFYTESVRRVGEPCIAAILGRHVAAIASARENVRTLRKLP